MNSLRAFWARVPATIRKPLIFMVGFAVVAAGIAMLALPGPGWAAIFLGFAILATEFAFAEKVRDWLVVQLKAGIAWCKKRWNKLVKKTGPAPAANSQQPPSITPKETSKNTAKKPKA